MSSWAKPGVKCICVNDGGWVVSSTSEIGTAGPAFGDVVTIRSVGRDIDGLFLIFHEWIGPDEEFVAFCFRPLADRTQEDDLALFTRLIEGAPMLEKA